MFNSRFYKATCPACLKPFDDRLPDSIVAEDYGLAHRCPSCRHWLVVYVRPIGSQWPADLRLIDTNVQPDISFRTKPRMIG